jgi:hypothetical protein
MTTPKFPEDPGAPVFADDPKSEIHAGFQREIQAMIPPTGFLSGIRMQLKPTGGWPAAADDEDDEPDDTCHCGHPECGAC